MKNISTAPFIFYFSRDVRNSMPTIFVVIMCFILPANYAFLRYCRRRGGPVPTGPTPSLITWKFIQGRVPWGLVFLLGGGFALAEGSKQSGMAKMIGTALIGLKALPHAVLLLVVILVAVFLTAFSSNVAIANIIIPVLAEMVSSKNICAALGFINTLLSISFSPWPLRFTHCT